MPDDRFVLRRVDWRELCPWLMIFRCLRLALTIPILFLATVGALLMPLGDMLSRKLFEPPAVMTPSVVPATPVVPPVQIVLPSRSPVPVFDIPTFFSDKWWRSATDARGVYWSIMQPLFNLFDPLATTRTFVRNILTSLWNIAVWALFGAAITRIAIVHLAREERISLNAALRHTLRNYGWYFAAPLFPLIGVVLLAIPLAVLGLLMRLDIGVLLAGIVWPLVLIAGLAMAILVFGLLIGWPLMWPTISAEEQSDAFEAFSRSFSYSFQRPLHYFFYAVVAVFLGYLGWLFVGNFAEVLIALNHWAVSLGAGSVRTAMVLNPPEEPSNLLWAGSGLIHWWDWLVRLIAQAFNYAFFFCVASAIYLLLRRQVDQTDFDEVYVQEDAARYGLPPLKTGPEGIPEPADTAKETTN
jgi:hypothetical protein